VNALRRTHGCTQFATDALFHAVFVTIQNMATVQAFWLWNLFVHHLGALAYFTIFRLSQRAAANSATRILRCYLVFATALTGGDDEASEVTH
jgi:hypothetical protein